MRLFGYCSFIPRYSLCNTQDDSDDEAVCTKRAQPRKRHRNLESTNSYVESLIEFSCEEGEETASSEVGMYLSVNSLNVWYLNCLLILVYAHIQENEMEASEIDSSNDEEEEEWKSDSSRYTVVHHGTQDLKIKSLLFL